MRFPRLSLALGALALLGLAPPARAQAGATCADCHAEVAQAAARNVHLQVLPFEVRGQTTGCQGCHGDGSQHMQTGDAAHIRAFKSDADDQACLACHQHKNQAEWHASTHATEGVSCRDCHKVHAANRPLEACRSCHARELAQFQLPSHHPVREGKLTCASCHDVHSRNEAQLRTRQRVNDLCANCHQGKEGPFVYEHQPVQEDCRLCHVPHGSVANKLLTANEPMLCLQCHEPHFHGGYAANDGDLEIGGIHRESPQGTLGLNKAFNTKCTQCHSQVHGSDLPGQGITSRGNGLVR